MSAASPDVPAALRHRLVELAARTVGELEPLLVPSSLRRVRAFAPAKRAASGSAPLWAALEADAAFRARVARTWRHAHPEVASLVGGAEDDDERAPDDPRSAEVATGPAAEPAPESGGPALPPSVDAPAPSWDAAVGAWLHAQDWSVWVPRELDAAEPASPDPAVARLRTRAEELTRALEESRAQAAALTDEVATTRRELRRLRSDADRARAQGRQAAQDAQTALEEARAAQAAAADAQRVAAEDLRAARAERDAARAEVRVARRLADARVRLLLDTIVDAASGLRTELALPPAADLPADLVAPEPDAAPVRVGSRGRLVDDPTLLDELLRLPRAHLVVDGYNVTKSAFGGLTLELQRRHLVDGLASLAARTGAEVTCCFDGRPSPMPTASLARGVRVRFSVGEIADDLIRRLVRAEPAGRVVVVVTSDQEVTHDVEADGAYVVPSATLVGWLQRR